MPRDNLPELVKQAAADVVRGLAMEADDPGFTMGGRCYAQLSLEDTSNVTLPAWVLASDEGLKEELAPLDSEWRGRKLSLWCVLKDRRGPKDHSKDAQYRSWRQEVIDAFHERRSLSPAVPACYWCEVTPDPVYKQDDRRFQDVRSALVLKFWLRVPRYTDTLVQLAQAGLQPEPATVA